MSEFWDDLFDDTEVDEDEEESVADSLQDILKEILGDAKEDLMEMLGKVARATPQFTEARGYLHDGMQYIIDNYRNDEDEVVTHNDTSHCLIVDAVMIDTVEDDEISDLLEAIEGGDELEVMQAIKDLSHHSIHLGMAVGIGMLIDEGKVEG